MEGGSRDCCVLCLLSLSDVAAKRHTDCSQENTAANQNAYRHTTCVCEVNKHLYREVKSEAETYFKIILTFVIAKIIKTPVVQHSLAQQFFVHFTPVCLFK